jgi:adenylate kinase family enzyme
MKEKEFPIFKTKTPGVAERFNLDDPVERRRYFEAKAGPEVEKLRDWVRNNSFVAFLLGKKGSGKGTYTKLFMEIVGPEHVAHISVGDIVRSVHKELSDPSKKQELMEFLKKSYRGFLPISRIFDVIEGRDVTTLLPTEVILALVERQMDKIGRKSVFIDGFPRNLDQVSYSLYFRSLIGYRDNPDFFVFIDVPEQVIHERIITRVVCPKCQTPRTLKLLRTKQVGYDIDNKQFYLICDNPSCEPTRMVSKEGGELGIEGFRDRIEADEKVMETLMRLEGVPQIFLRNSIPAELARQYADDYELTPSYSYKWHEDKKEVEVIEQPWIIKDDGGVPSNSLMAPAVALALIKQIAQVLGL